MLAVVDGCRVGDVELLGLEFDEISLWIAISEGTLMALSANFFDSHVQGLISTRTPVQSSKINNLQ